MTRDLDEGRVRVLTSNDLPRARELLTRDPVESCFVASRVSGVGLDPWRLGGELWGFIENGEITSLAYVGANFIPIEASSAALAHFAQRALRAGRRCSSLVGPAGDVLALWDLLSAGWGPARDVRANQPLMVLDGEPQVEIDPQVELVTLAHLDTLVPACIAMFTEEVGVSPVAGGMSQAYRARIGELISSGRSFARFDQGRVVFKAEIGAVANDVFQIQGVWIDPALRGRGIAASAMAAVVSQARALCGHTASLYVNDYNTVARKVYERVGFRTVGTFATVLF